LRKHANSPEGRFSDPRTFGIVQTTTSPLEDKTTIELEIHRHHFERCDSTNESAIEWLKTASSGDIGIFTTDHQLSGKGQRGARWEHGKGLDLAWTLAINWEPDTSAKLALHANVWFALNKAIALATLQTIDDALKPAASPTRIKWPNDLYVQSGKIWEKCGGILIENAWKGQHISGSVIGIGINALSSDLPRYRTSLSQVAPNIKADQFDPRILGKSLEKNVRLAIEEWKVACTFSSSAAAAYHQKMSKLFDACLLAKGIWKSYRWKNEAKVGKIAAVDGSGRCIMEWKKTEDSGSLQSIENNKQLQWSWIYDQLDAEAN